MFRIIRYDIVHTTARLEAVRSKLNLASFTIHFKKQSSALYGFVQEMFSPPSNCAVMKKTALVTDRVLFITKAMVIAGLKNPPLKQVEMFTNKAYEKPKHSEMLTTVGPVSSFGQAIVEPHPSRTRNIVQTHSTTNGMKMANTLCHCTMFSATAWRNFILHWSSLGLCRDFHFVHFDWLKACRFRLGI